MTTLIVLVSIVVVLKLAGVYLQVQSERRGRVYLRSLEASMNTIDDIASEMIETKTLLEGLDVFITGLQQAVKNANGDQAKIDAVFAQARANRQKLHDAFVANTPADDTTPTTHTTPTDTTPAT